MTKYIDLNFVRSTAKYVLDKYGEDHRNLVYRPWIEGDTPSTGCVNVVAVKDGVRQEITTRLLNLDEGRDWEDVSLREMTVENLENSGVKLEPGCFVGTILIESRTVTIKQFVEGPKGDMANCTIGNGVEVVLNMHDIVASKGARKWLYRAQSKQDSGATWGEAAAAADKYVLDELMLGSISFNL